MTKSILLGLTNGFGDFLGIAAPFTVRFKVLMRQFFLLDEPLAWNEPVPEQFRAEWISLIVEALEAGVLPFP